MTSLVADVGLGRDPDDAGLLARYAPILQFDRRELFFPTAIEPYVEHATLVTGDGARFDQIEASELDHRFGPGSYLRFIADSERERDPDRGRVDRSATGRLAQVGLFGRLLDVVFLLSVWLRSTVPKRTVHAALAKADRLGMHSKATCYGRLVRQGEWLVAHYAFFYAMNDWRTTHRGLNDHEADWEQLWIFIDPTTEEPEWIASTNHDYAGPDMRRHWTDPELEVVGSRPVLFPAAGSHALMFRRGDYVARLDVPGTRWLVSARNQAMRLPRRSQVSNDGVGPALGVPFIDLARGDGRRVGGDEHPWELVVMADQPWVRDFRGLWGLDTGDLLDAERGPGGPKFDRSGRIRSCWADPVGFAGLHGHPPPSAASARVNQRKIAQVIADLDHKIREHGRLLPLLQQSRDPGDVSSSSASLTRLMRHRTELADLQRRLSDGEVAQRDVRSHLRRPATPLSEVQLRRGLRTALAAVTMPVVLALGAAVAMLERVDLRSMLLVFAAVVIPLDQIATGRYARAVSVVGGLIFVGVAWPLVTSAVAPIGESVVGLVLILFASVLAAVNVVELRATWRGHSRG